jgi:hypothetical protein
MAHYMDGYGASYGLLVAIANEEPARLEKLARAFQQIPNVSTVAFDLTKGITASATKRRPSSGPESRRRSKRPATKNATASIRTRLESQRSRKRKP